MHADPRNRRVYVYCGDELADCPFARGGDAEDGLPILTVDEEIYRLAPAFVIATVDKFARLAREGEAASLFGYVSRRCERHGYVHPDYQHCDIKDGGKHPAKDGLPAAAVRPVARLRPPDLIIQDELHLITGALGTTVGLFEVAIDALTSWRTAAGQPARPLLVASTATARNAPEQVRALYGRDRGDLPAAGARRRAGRSSPARSRSPRSTRAAVHRHLHHAASGSPRRRSGISEVLLAAGQLLLDRAADHAADDADPYLTLVGYFSATRELAGMARYLGDDVQTALAKGRPWSAAAPAVRHRLRRRCTSPSSPRGSPARTSPRPLTRWPCRSTPTSTRTAGKRATAPRCGRRASRSPTRDATPFDVVLATSMLQVGVDVTRLGLMLVVGQPKNTAEYIQASSRVGRDRGQARPGRRPRQLGPAPRPGPLRAVPALPRDVLRPGRGAVGHPVLGHRRWNAASTGCWSAPPGCCRRRSRVRAVARARRGPDRGTARLRRPAHRRARRPGAAAPPTRPTPSSPGSG